MDIISTRTLLAPPLRSTGVTTGPAAGTRAAAKTIPGQFGCSRGADGQKVTPDGRIPDTGGVSSIVENRSRKWVMSL